jgi:hypothetical protein
MRQLLGLTPGSTLYALKQDFGNINNINIVHTGMFSLVLNTSI